MNNIWRKAQEFERNYWQKEEGKLQDDEIEFFWKNYLKRLNLALNNWEKKKILEVGCGPKGLIYFCKGNLKVGLDPLAFYYKDAFQIKDQFYLIHGRAENLPFFDSTFDCVFLINVLDHVQFPELAMKEASRVLKPAGELVFHVELDSPIKKIIRNFVNKDHHIGHPHNFKSKDIERLFSTANIQIISCKTGEDIIGLLRNVPKSFYNLFIFLLYLPDNLFYRIDKDKFATTMYIYAKKF